ncbi:hypothetical protein B0O80DRAFT_260442 [Mortierella sp. GBAus27b]|nr:hypothetical protein B0O80DRAFT_260442 [Mortierella sp. GBAus27b]
MLDKNRETITRFRWLCSNFGKRIQDQQRLWDVLSDDTDTGGMKHLKHLSLYWVIIQPLKDGRSTPHSTFAKLCQRLETLQLWRSRLTDWPISMSGLPQDKDNGDSSLPMFWNMRKVTFDWLEGDLVPYVRFLSQCPLLEHLTWSLETDRESTPGFLRYLAQSRLKSLEISGIILPDEDLAQLLEHLPSTFTTLALQRSTRAVHMGPRFIAATAALTLPGLSLLPAYGIPWTLSSDIIQQLFSSCPCLIRLDIKQSVMMATDLATAPWIASRLVQLDLLITGVEKLDTCVDPTCTCGGEGTCVVDKVSSMNSSPGLCH